MMEGDLEMDETLGVPELRSFSVSYKMKYTFSVSVNIFTQADHQHAHEKVH